MVPRVRMALRIRLFSKLDGLRNCLGRVSRDGGEKRLNVNILGIFLEFQEDFRKSSLP